LIATAPVLVIVMFAARPVFQALTVALTRQLPLDPLGGVVVAGGTVVGHVVGWVVGGGVVRAVVEGAPRSRPKNEMAYAAMPLCGRLCPAPWMLYASTWTVPEESA
jgi:hypothetical protein